MFQNGNCVQFICRVNRFSFYCHFQAGCSPPQCSNVTNHELIYAVNSSQELDMTQTNVIDPYRFESCSDWLISFWNRMILFIFYQVDWIESQFSIFWILFQSVNVWKSFYWTLKYFYRSNFWSRLSMLG